MVQLIVGSKGKGKTKHLLNMAAEAVQKADGTVVYIDRSSQHMYELSNRIRLINISDFPVSDESGYLGFISGVIAQDHDLEYMFLDGFLTVTGLAGGDIAPIIDRIESLANRYQLHFIISVSADSEQLPESVKKYIAVAI